MNNFLENSVEDILLNLYAVNSVERLYFYIEKNIIPLIPNNNFDWLTFIQILKAQKYFVLIDKYTQKILFDKIFVYRVSEWNAYSTNNLDITEKRYWAELVLQLYNEKLLEHDDILLHMRNTHMIVENYFGELCMSKYYDNFSSDDIF